jgi:hypothetical protein
MLNWIWIIHDKVNEKLHKHDRPGVNVLKKRMKVYTTVTSPGQMLDILFTLATNHDANGDENKDLSIANLLTVLPKVVALLLHRKNLSELLQMCPIPLLLTSENLMLWVYNLYQKVFSLDHETLTAVKSRFRSIQSTNPFLFCGRV